MTPDQIKTLRSLPMREAMQFWDAFEKAARERKEFWAAVRLLCQIDLFYLLAAACNRVDMVNAWAYERCREVEANPDGHLDLWAREHFKSSIITFGLTIQKILNDPNITVGIFSHTRPIAKAFLRQIMRELEANERLHAAFPDVLWGKDTRQAPKWSEDDGIIVKRSANPNEATVEAWGLVDGQPTSKHFRDLLYDDIVVQASVTTPEMIQKTMTALEQSYNLGVTPGGTRRFAGTRWHFNDAYSTIIQRGSAKLRYRPGRVNGEESGKSVYWPEEVHEQKRRDMGPYTYAAQILLNPKADALQGFKREWLRFYDRMTHADRMVKYILVDAANSKKRSSDYTAMVVVGLATDGNYYVLDMVRDRLNLSERTERLFFLVRKWKPKPTSPKLFVRYERYGLMSDADHIRSKQEDEGYRFEITEVGGQTSKEDRIKRLLPLFEQGKIYLPRSLHATNWERTTVDLVNAFVEEEYMAFPVGVHDDVMDALSRICEVDFKLVWPKEETAIQPPPPRNFHTNVNTAWMA